MTKLLNWDCPFIAMRVRCINNAGLPDLKIGAEYAVIRGDATHFQLKGRSDYLLAHRFKPVVRVKMRRLDTNEMLAQREADFVFFRTGGR